MFTLKRHGSFFTGLDISLFEHIRDQKSGYRFQEYRSILLIRRKLCLTKRVPQYVMINTFFEGYGWLLSIL